MNEVVLSFEKEATQEWDFTISVKKTKVLVARYGEHLESTMQLDIRNEVVENVDEFVYLGSLLTEDGTSSKDINRRVNNGYFKFSELRKSVWNQPCISLKTKVKIYKAVVLSAVLYGAETWTCRKEDYNKLNVFNTKLLRTLLGRKRDEISNKDLYKLTGTCPLEMVVRRNRLRWAGHVRRMNNDRLSKKILFGKVVGGKQEKW